MEAGLSQRYSRNGEITFKPIGESPSSPSSETISPVSIQRPEGFTSAESSLVSRLQGSTYANMPPVRSGVDPYSVTEAAGSRTPPEADYPDDDASLDEGTSSSTLSSINEYSPNDQNKPRSSTVIEKFEEHIEAHWPLKDGEEDKLRNLDIDEKWKMVQDQVTRAPIFSASHYADNLKSHANKPRTSKKQVNSANVKSASWSLSTLLRKLKLDLKLSHDSFVQEFVSTPHCGIEKLVTILGNIQSDLSASAGTKSKMDVYKQAAIDEYDCLLCIKFACAIEEGCHELAVSTKALETIAPCLMSDQRKNTAIVIQILTLACSASGGQQAVWDAMSHVRLKYGENVRFKMMVGMMNSQKDVRFKALCVRLFNTMVEKTENMNTRVYLQQELLLAGFDPSVLEKSSFSLIPEEEALQLEVEKWQANYIDVSGSRHQILQLENRNTQLRQEVDRLNVRITTAEKEAEKMTRFHTDTRNKSERYRERAAELQDMVTKLTVLYREKTGLNPEEEINLTDAGQSLDRYGTVHITGTSQRPSMTSMPSSDSLDVPAAPAAPAVPPPPPAFLSKTVRQKVVQPRVNLPLFNWTPLYAIRGTVFENFDDEARLRELDFDELEEQFKLPEKKESETARQKRERVMDHIASRLTFVEVNRAKNMIITKTRVAKSVQQRLFWEEPLTSRDIKDAIEHCDLNILPGEYAELLLKYIPSKIEVKKLAQHATQYNKMGEAEQFLFQLAQVERLEAKLSMMAFIGIFDELLDTVKPQIEMIRSTSQSVASSVQLRKILELILAHGNYMNSGKRGYALGFRLDSLEKLTDVKSFDKRITLLHYIADVVDKSYPELSEFYTDIDITIEKGVSYQGLAGDVQGLRKGIDMIKYEIERQPSNSIIKMFLARASSEIAEIAESFRRAEEAYKAVCSLFSERYRDIEPEDLFRPIAKFTAAFKVAQRENFARANPPSPISPRINSPGQTSVNFLRRISQSEPSNLSAKVDEPQVQLRRPVPVSEQNGKPPQTNVSPRPKSFVAASEQKEAPRIPENGEPVYAQVQRKPSVKTASGVRGKIKTSTPPVPKKANGIVPLEILAVDEEPLYDTIDYSPPSHADVANGATPLKANGSKEAKTVFSNQVEEAIGSLDQVLNDAMEEGPPSADVSQSSYL